MVQYSSSMLCLCPSVQQTHRLPWQDARTHVVSIPIYDRLMSNIDCYLKATPRVEACSSNSRVFGLVFEACSGERPNGSNGRNIKNVYEADGPLSSESSNSRIPKLWKLRKFKKDTEASNKKILILSEGKASGKLNFTYLKKQKLLKIYNLREAKLSRIWLFW